MEIWRSGRVVQMIHDAGRRRGGTACGCAPDFRRQRRQAGAIPQVHHGQGGELPDFGREEMNQTCVPSKVHISELFVHRDVAPHAAETDAAGGSLV